MCIIANVFYTNIETFDGKKTLFCPECLDCKTLAKINFL